MLEILCSYIFSGLAVVFAEDPEDTKDRVPTPGSYLVTYIPFSLFN